MKYTMEDVVDYLGLECGTNHTSVNIECPVCSRSHRNRRKTLNINFVKHDGIFNCPRCNTSGGIVDLYMLYTSTSNKDEAKKELAAIFSKPENTITHKKNVELHEMKQKQFKRNKIAPIEKRDEVYNALLEQLTLHDNHIKALQNRGLPNEIIIKNNYKSVPRSAEEALANALLNKGFVLEDIAGFYKPQNKPWSIVHYSAGILIPIRNEKEQIQGFQIRLDETTNAKYISFSSNFKENGTPSKNFLHFRKGKKGYENIIITEGVLKADIISYFSGYSVLGLIGVNSTNNLPNVLHELKRKGLKKLYVAFDMDLYTNKNVEHALDKLNDIIIDCDLKFSNLTWDRNFKGLDDYLYNQYLTIR